MDDRNQLQINELEPSPDPLMPEHMERTGGGGDNTRYMKNKQAVHDYVEELQVSTAQSDEHATVAVEDQIDALPYVDVLGDYKDKNLMSAAREMYRKDGNKKIRVFGTVHQRNIEDEQIQQIKQEITQNPSDVYLVEVDPAQLDVVYTYPSAEEAMNAMGESAYTAWLAHAAGKEVASWDIPYITQLEEGMKHTGVRESSQLTVAEAVAGSVIGQGLVHVLEAEQETGAKLDRAEALVSTIRDGLGEQVIDFLEQKLARSFDAVAIREIVKKTKTYDLDTMTAEELNNFFNPSLEGDINNANAACNKSRDIHAVETINKYKKMQSVNTVSVVTGQDHTSLWARPLEALYPEQVV